MGLTPGFLNIGLDMSMPDSAGGHQFGSPLVGDIDTDVFSPSLMPGNRFSLDIIGMNPSSPDEHLKQDFSQLEAFFKFAPAAGPTDYKSKSVIYPLFYLL